MNYINEAFKRLNDDSILNEESFSMTKDGIEDLEKFRDGDNLDIITVIDPEAANEDELQDSYVGKVILQCEVCNSMIYKDPEDVIIDETSEIVNSDEECPYCANIEGYKVVGQVAPFSNEEPTEETEESTEEETEVTIDDKEVEEESTNSSVNESKSINEDVDINKDYFIQTPAKEFDYYEPTFDISKLKVGTKINHSDSDNPLTITDIYSHPSYNTYGNISGIEVTDNKDKYDLWFDNETLRYKGYVGGALKKITLVESESIKESIESLSLDTDDTHMEMTSEENGKVTITTEPKSSSDSTESIAPLEPEVEAEFETETSEDEQIEETEDSEDDEINFEVDEIVEESFNYLSENYLKKVYGNVQSYKTIGAKSNGNKLILEGVIKFKSGKEKHTSFIFEAKTATKKGKVRFLGENAQITKGRKAFSLLGSIEDGKLLTESLTYNYRTKDQKGSSNKIYGTIKNK